MVIAPNERCWLTAYGLALAALIGLALAVHLRMPTYRKPPLDFYSMAAGDIFITYGLTRRQAGSVKLGFAESFAPPEIGLYGNHIFSSFGGEAFGRPGDAKYFFNYTYANLSLPEVHLYLRHIENLGRLPTKLILVQITPPNADNGRFIINWGNELPPDVLLSDLRWKGPLDTGLQVVAISWEFVQNWLHEVLNYNTFVWGVIQGNEKDRLIGPRACHGVSLASSHRLPIALRNIVGSMSGRQFYCQPTAWESALRRDGSVGGLEDERPTSTTQPQLAQNENSLNDADRGLSAGDETEIVRQLRAIDAVGRRHGVKVVFIIGPVYETDRHDSAVNRIFDRAVALVPEIQLIDNRDMRANPALFSDPIHPGPEYFRIVVDQLRHRGLVE